LVLHEFAFEIENIGDYHPGKKSGTDIKCIR